MSKRPVIYQLFCRLFSNGNQTNKPWGTLTENGVGKFNDIQQPALAALKAFGITHIWYTGVIEHAVMTDYSEYGIEPDYPEIVKGRAGSPYAIKDYYDVNPDLAVSVNDRMQEFEQLIQRTHQMDMQVIIDFIPNHVSRHYHSDAKPESTVDFGESDDPNMAFSPQNNFYYLPGQHLQVPEGNELVHAHDLPRAAGQYEEFPAKATGNDVFSAAPGMYDWYETIKLNYGIDYLHNRSEHFDPIPDTWLKMKAVLLYWAAKGVDGFRCDMVEMVPVAFWNWVIPAVKTVYPTLTFTAEVYNPHTYRSYIFDGHFDYLYDKEDLYDTLKAIIQKRASTDDLTRIWQQQDGIRNHMLRFLENHDEQRLASPYFAGHMQKGIPLMALSAFMHDGPVMMYFGQEVGEPARGGSGHSGDDGRTTIFDYWSVPEHLKWVNNGAYDGGQLSEDQLKLRAQYQLILNAVNEQEALREGAFYDLHYYNRNNDYIGYSNRVYAFVRHTPNQVVLIVVNLGEQSATASIKIPQAAWETFGLTGPQIKMTGNHSLVIDRESTIDYTRPSDLVLELSPLAFQLITLTSS